VSLGDDSAVGSFQLKHFLLFVCHIYHVFVLSVAAILFDRVPIGSLLLLELLPTTVNCDEAVLRVLRLESVSESCFWRRFPRLTKLLLLDRTSHCCAATLSERSGNSALSGQKVWYIHRSSK
jgi:hypothetical protein